MSFQDESRTLFKMINEMHITVAFQTLHTYE